MKPLTIEEIAEAVGGKLISKGKQSPIAGISTDSRTIKDGDLFIPLKGENFDGHDFLDDALKNGAAAVIIHNEKYNKADSNVILTDNTLEALKRLAAYYVRLFDIQIVAITGSTGKTTTKDMIYSVLSENFKTVKTQGNYNNEIGLPLTVFNIEEDHEIAVLEMGMSNFGEIERLAQIAPPNVGVITNIGVSHIESLGSRENILKAKTELFKSFNNKSTAIINGDNNLLRGFGENVDYPVIFYGLSNDCHIKAYNIQTKGETGIIYSLDIDQKTYNISLRTPGVHNIYNSLAAIAVGRIYGMSMQDIIKGISNYHGTDMRFRIHISATGVKIIDDAYNASPDSMKAALAALKEFDSGRRIAVLGDMLELGSYSEQGHRDVGKAAASTSLDYLVVIGIHSRYIADEAVKYGLDKSCVFTFDDKAKAEKWLIDTVHPGDIVLVKGSRGMKMEQIVNTLCD